MKSGKRQHVCWECALKREGGMIMYMQNEDNWRIGNRVKGQPKQKDFAKQKKGFI